MFANVLRRTALWTALATVAALSAGVNPARADNQTKTDAFDLTRNDFSELKFTPGAPGQIKIEADWKGTGVVKKDIALRMQLVEVDGGKVLKEVTGGSPLPASFNLTADEFAKVKAKGLKIVMRHNVAGQDDERVKGTVSVTFPIATVTLLDTSAKPEDLGGKGSKLEHSFTIPNKTGKIEVSIVFKDGLLNGKDLIAELVRADGLAVTSSDGNSGLKLAHTVNAADLAKGTKWTVRLTNNGNSQVKGIKIVAKFTPTN